MNIWLLDRRNMISPLLSLLFDDTNATEFQSNETFEESPNYTFMVCILFKNIELVRRKANVKLDIIHYFRKDRSDLICFEPLKNDSNLQLNFSSNKMILNQVYILMNPKLSTVYKLVMILMNPKSRRSLTRFVQIELRNPSASLFRYYNPRWLKRSEGAAVIAEFESNLPFSNETLTWVNACQVPHRNDTLFQLADQEFVNGLLAQSEDLRSFWNGSTCPVRTGMRLESEEVQTNVKLTFSLSYIEPPESLEVFSPIADLTKFSSFNYPSKDGYRLLVPWPNDSDLED